MDIDLAAYFEQQPRGAMKRMADDLGVAAAMISQWVAGTRPIPPRYVPKIERMTGMLVRRWTMCPDWADIWEELIGHPEAPRVGVCIPDSSADQRQSEAVSA
jgi:DNA-binding transcriptional regulator YdaS (Cro superfamily)